MNLAYMHRAINRPRRPFGVTLLAFGVLILTGLNFLRLIESIKQWGFLAQLLPVSPLYIAFTGLVWTVGGILLLWGLWRGRPWAPSFSKLLTSAYIIYYWLDRLAFANIPSRRVNWPFASGVSVISLIFVFWTLSRPKAKAFFGEAYEQ
jgi:hypothetical protein